MADSPGGGPRTTNAIVQDLTIRHATLMERVKAAHVAAVLALLRHRVAPRLRDVLSARLVALEALGLDPGPRMTERTREALREVEAILAESMVPVQDRAISDLRDVATAEAQWQVDTYRKAIPTPIEIKVDFVNPTPEFLEAIVTTKPFEGALLGDWFAAAEKATAERIKQTVEEGQATGMSTDKIVDEIMGKGEGDGASELLERNVKSIVRTATNHTANEAHAASANANPSIVKGWRFLATLDTRTTTVCMAHDGEEYALDDVQWQPPLHWGCRSTRVDILKPWSELGIPGLGDLPTASRSAMDGTVPATTTYPEWLKGQSKRVQDEALGPERAEIFRRGELEIKDFVTKGGKPLSLKALRRLEGELDAA